MNQEKIGKFIQEKRKSKNLTQSELANSLGVSEKTVSNWENGRNMPDLSLFKPLCEELDISINDLMNGEEVSEDNYQDKLEETLIKTIDYKDKKNNKKFKIVIGFVIVLFIILLGSLLLTPRTYIDYLDPYPIYLRVDIDKGDYDKQIREYLLKDLHNNEEGKWFVNYKVYSIEEVDNNTYYVYTWVLEEQFSYNRGILKNNSGASYPCRFELHNEDGTFSVISKDMPRDGSLYLEDLKSYFPDYVRRQIERDESIAAGLSEKLEKEVKKYYKIK